MHSYFIGDRYDKEVRYLSVDFSHGQDVYDDIQAEISDIDVAVLGTINGELVCNVHFGMHLTTQKGFKSWSMFSISCCIAICCVPLPLAVFNYFILLM